jgi:hypothetical protein
MASTISRRDVLRLIAASGIATSVHAAGERRLFAQVPYIQRGTY